MNLRLNSGLYAQEDFQRCESWISMMTMLKQFIHTNTDTRTVTIKIDCECLIDLYHAELQGRMSLDQNALDGLK